MLWASANSCIETDLCVGRGKLPERLQRSTADAVVDALRRAEEVETEVEYVTEKIGNVVIGQSSPEHVLGRQPVLLDSVVPMLDPTALLEHDVKEIRHVAGREDAWRARFEMLVDQDAVAKPDAAVAKKLSLRRHADRVSQSRSR